MWCFLFRPGAARHSKAGLFSANFSSGWPVRRPLGAPPRRPHRGFCWGFLGLSRGPAGLRPVEYGLGRPPALEGISTVLCKQNRLKSPRATEISPARDSWSRKLTKQRRVVLVNFRQRADRDGFAPNGPSKTKFCPLAASTRPARPERSSFKSRAPRLKSDSTISLLAK